MQSPKLRRFIYQTPRHIRQLLLLHQFKPAVGNKLAQRSPHHVGGIRKGAGFHGVFHFARQVIRQFHLQCLHISKLTPFTPTRQPNSLPKKFLNLPNHVHKRIHLRLGVVEVKTRPGRGFHAQLVHQRLGAMMTAAQRDARLIG